jgi:rhodanese-related sulfurtransferase
MSVKRVSPDEALGLMQNEGYVYLDVRSVPEFEAGHPDGAYNVPLLDLGPYGMAPNPAFLKVVEAHFPKDARIVVGCKAGGRSLAAASLLESHGYTQVIDQRAGFDGGGEPGWRPRGLPVSKTSAPERAYAELAAKVV